MSRRGPIANACLGVAVLATLSCARFGYESLAEGAFDPIANDTNVTHGGELGGSGGVNDGDAATGDVFGGTGGAPAGGSGSSLDAGDSGGSGGLDAATSNGGTGGSVLSGCGPAVATATWSFASDTESWVIEADPGATGNLNWTAATGDPAPGALEVDATVANGLSNVYVYIDRSPSDFGGKVIYARVFLDAGSGVTAKVYVQTGASAWGDGEEVYLQAQQWQCVSFDLADPAVITPGFDRTAVRRVGVFFFGNASSRLYVDQITY